MTSASNKGSRKAALPPTDDRPTETRDRLLEAGLDLFGRQGFEATSTRAIADRAHVNLGAIPYHFGSKEGLYIAVAEHIVGEIRSRIGGTAADALAALDRGLGPVEARELLTRITNRFVDVVVANEGGERWGPFMMREQMTPTPAFDRIYTNFIGPMNVLLCRLIGVARGGAHPDDSLRVLTLIGQALVFRAARAAVLRRMEWDEITPPRLAEIKRVLAENITAILTGSGPA